MGDLFGFWGKFQNVRVDFIIFALLVIFIFKFKDIFDVYFKFKSHKTEALKSAKDLLELSGGVDSKEMVMVNKMMELHAIKLATGVINDKYGKIYCYLFSKCKDERIYGLHKTVPFVTIDGAGFSFNKKSLRNKRLNGVGISFAFALLMIYMSYIYGNIAGVNFSWFFQTMLVIELGILFCWWVRILPDDIQVKSTIDLLMKTSVEEFEKFNATPTTTPSEIINLEGNSVR